MRLLSMLMYVYEAKTAADYSHQLYYEEVELEDVVPLSQLLEEADAFLREAAPDSEG